MTCLEKDLRRVKAHAATPPPAEHKVKPSVKKKRAAHTRAVHGNALKTARRNLKAAQHKFEDQILHEAQRQCRPICEQVYQKLPAELRVTIYASLILSRNATFYAGPGDSIKLANGTSRLQHCFDAAFTGPEMHREMLHELALKGIRFDFRHSHNLLLRIVPEYMATHAFDVRPVLGSVGITVNADDIKSREKVLECLAAFEKFPLRTRIVVFFETDSSTEAQHCRVCGQIYRAIRPGLERLRACGYCVRLVWYAGYTRSVVRNKDGSRFSLSADYSP
jgi:hypothetical protein